MKALTAERWLSEPYFLIDLCFKFLSMAHLAAGYDKVTFSPTSSVGREGCQSIFQESDVQSNEIKRNNIGYLEENCGRSSFNPGTSLEPTSVNSLCTRFEFIPRIQCCDYLTVSRTFMAKISRQTFYPKMNSMRECYGIELLQLFSALQQASSRRLSTHLTKNLPSTEVLAPFSSIGISRTVMTTEYSTDQWMFITINHSLLHVIRGALVRAISGTSLSRN